MTELHSHRTARNLVLAGVASLVLGGVVHLLATAHWSVRIPRGWSSDSVFVGATTQPDAATGLFPEADTTAIYERHARVIDETGRPHRVVLTDSYVNRDPRTGEEIYDYTLQVPVDPRTGRHATPAYSSDYFVFPRNTQRRTYRLRNTYLRGVPFRFQGEELVEGLPAYRFGYSGAMEYTDFYRGTGDEPAMDIPAGQEIRCWQDQYGITFWVEPVTGVVLKLAEGCQSWDALVDTRTGAFRGNVLRWAAESSGNDVVRRVEEAWGLRIAILSSTRYIPIGLLLLGGLLLGAGLMALRARPAGTAP
ncbi:porin PorA family protein [Lysobacter sp. A3-1-A15]|uniref:porin PorA family protein n=1 Tax=Novilysobacter viscosus TaxID=3098602 RepID=UPI002EDA97F2